MVAIHIKLLQKSNKIYKDIRIQIKLYPLCLSFCHFAEIVRRIVECYCHVPVWLVYCHIVSSSLWGFVNTFIYCCICYKYSSNSTKLQHNGHGHRRRTIKPILFIHSSSGEDNPNFHSYSSLPQEEKQVKYTRYVSMQSFSLV